MVRYRFDGIDTLSPIDWIFQFTLINLQSSAVTIESYTFVTQQQDGHWISPFEIPKEHLELYSVMGHPGTAYHVPSENFGHDLTTQLPANGGETTVRILFECPKPPKALKRMNDDNWLVADQCFGGPIGLNIKERNGTETSVAAEFDERAPDMSLTLPRESTTDLRNIRVIRPFPPRLFWTVPNKGTPQAFDNNANRILRPTPNPPNPKRRENTYEL